MKDDQEIQGTALGLPLDPLMGEGGDSAPVLDALLRLDEGLEDRMFQGAMGMMDAMVDYKELLAMSACAMRTVQTKLKALDQEFDLRLHRNPIHSIETRLKSSASIAEKAARKGIAFTPESVEANIHDIAGVRVICSFVDDVYLLADALSRQADVTVLVRKDYIASPKPNGYRSLHLVLTVPVYFSQQTRDMAVEVQIRTIAMDFWASLEHQLKYKHEVKEQEEIVAQLKDCADQIDALDRQMLQIRERIAACADAPSREEQLLEKLRKLGPLSP